MVAEVRDEPAFPITDATNVHHIGMTLRDWFAGQALCGLLADTKCDGLCESEYAEQAYLCADAMMEARKK